MELDAKTLRTDEVIRGAFKTFEGQAGYMASKSKNALGSILSKEFLSNSVIKGGFKGAALGVAAGTLTTAVDRWLHPDGQIDNGVINGVSVLARSAAVGAIGGIGATAAIGALRNIKSDYSSEIAKEAFQIGKKETLEQEHWLLLVEGLEEMYLWGQPHLALVHTLVGKY